MLERGECGCPDLHKLNWYCLSSAMGAHVIILMERALWGLSHFSVIGSGRGGGMFLLPTYFRVAKRRLGSAEAPKTNKCPGAKPLPGKLPKGQ